MKLFAPIITGSTHITGSLAVTGSVIVTGSVNDLFLIKNAVGSTLLRVSQSGVVVMTTQSVAPSGSAPNGAIAFTSNSLFIGLD